MTGPSAETTRASFTLPSTGCWRTEPRVPYGRLPRAQISPYGDSDIAYPTTIRIPNRRSISRCRSRSGAGPV